MKKLLLVALVFGGQIMGCAQAESPEKAAAPAASVSGDHAANIEKIKAELSAFPLESVEPSPIPGVYEVIVQGQIIYFTGDMKYAIQGSIIDHESRIDLTQQKLDKRNAVAFSNMKEGDYLAFKPEGESKFVLNVFTDVDCGFCRKLHQEVPELTAKGVEVRYFLYPRAGVNSGSARKLESVWCADDRNAAMDRAKNNQAVDPKRCDNPIENHIALANQMGLTGTPLLFTGEGTRISGYRPADQLYQMLLSEAVAAVKKGS